MCVTHPQRRNRPAQRLRYPSCNILSPTAAQPDAVGGVKSPQQPNTACSAAQHWLFWPPKGRGPSWRPPCTGIAPTQHMLQGCCGEQGAGCGSAAPYTACQSVMGELGSSPVLRLCFAFPGPASEASFQHARGSLGEGRQGQHGLLFSSRSQGGEKLCHQKARLGWLVGDFKTKPGKPFAAAHSPHLEQWHLHSWRTTCPNKGNTWDGVDSSSCSSFKKLQGC